MGRYNEAMAAYDEIVKSHPDSVVAKNGRAETFRSMGLYNEALAAYDQAVQSHPECSVSKSGRAETLRSMGRYEEALAEYGQAVEARPADVVTKTGRAETLRSMGRYDEALAAYDLAIKSHPGSVVAKSGRAETLRSMGLYGEALEAYKEVKKQFPENIRVTTGMAVVLASLGRDQEAIELLPAVPLVPADWVAWHVRGIISKLRIGKLDEAQRIFAIGLKEDPGPSHREYFRSALGLVQLRMRNWAVAQKVLERSKEPELSVANRILLFEAVGERKKVERVQEVALALAKKTVEINQLLPTKLEPVGKDLVSEFRRRYIQGEAATMTPEDVSAREWELLYNAGNSRLIAMAA